MRKIIIFIHFLIVSLRFSCNAQKGAGHKDVIPPGQWICVQDSLSSMIVTGKQMLLYYDGKPIDTIKYELSIKSCDSTYAPAKKEHPLFLLSNDGICSEVEYITETELMLTYTANGKLTTYKKRSK